MFDHVKMQREREADVSSAATILAPDEVIE
jgi:hypothetical protein